MFFKLYRSLGWTALNVSRLCFGWLGLAFLILPIIVIVPLSFNSGVFLTFPLEGYSLRWYEEVLNDPSWRRAARNSLTVGAGTTVLAVILGTLAAVGLHNSKIRGRAVLTALIISPMVVPAIISAIGVFFFFAKLGLVGSKLSLILAHTILAVPFVFIPVTASLTNFDQTLVRAALGLGASPIEAFRRVTFPLVAPGVATGAVFAFATSLDEVIMVLFLGGPAQRTLPREMFDGLRENISPAILAVATMLTILACFLLICVQFLQKRDPAP